MIQNELPVLLCYVQRVDTLAVNRTLQTEKITLQQLIILSAVHNNPNKHLIELATLTYLDRTSLSRNLELLIKKELITTMRGRDARCKKYRLTAAGIETMRASALLFESYVRELKEHLGNDMYHQICGTLSFYINDKPIVKCKTMCNNWSYGGGEHDRK